MPQFLRAIDDEFKSWLSEKDTATVNRFEAFQSNGAVVLRGRQGVPGFTAFTVTRPSFSFY
jgi:hypothetical protein